MRDSGRSIRGVVGREGGEGEGEGGLDVGGLGVRVSRSGFGGVKGVRGEGSGLRAKRSGSRIQV